MISLTLPVAALVLTGCASPGPPRAPSLQLPAPVNNLQATRRGSEVELSFTLPTRTTEGLAYRGATLRASVCRALDTGACLPVSSLTGTALSLPAPNSPHAVTLHDALPAPLTAGTPRLLTYRVELSNTQGRSAGFGDAACAPAGIAPAAVTGLSAQGSRQGIILRWAPSPASSTAAGEVVLRREQMGADSAPATKDAGKPKHGAQTIVMLGTGPLADPLGANTQQPLPAANANGVLDASATVNTAYLYAAERELTIQLAGHELVLHSALSVPVAVELRAIYPPPPPADLVGTAFPLASSVQTGAAPTLAIDLIWTPADDPGTVGYIITREPLDTAGASLGAPVSLTPQPVRTPSFHDVLPAAATFPGRVRYTVKAMDAAGLQSSPATVTVETGSRPDW